MVWNIVRFGKHEGSTLPMIVLHDPDYFFWAFDEGVFKRSRLTDEAAAIADKARYIAIPRSPRGKYEVEYVMDPFTLKLASITIVRASQHLGASTAMRSNRFDLSFPRTFAPYDKHGGRIMTRAIKRYFFGDVGTRLTRDRCESFFDDDDNFL